MDAPSPLIDALQARWNQDDPATFPRFLLSGPAGSVLAWGAKRSVRTSSDAPLRSALEHVHSIAGEDEVFGGARFMPSSDVDPAWAAFGGAFFFVPQEIVRVDAPIAAPPPKKVPATLEEVNAARYRAALDEALTQIAAGALEKVVVARRFVADARGAEAWASVPRSIASLLAAEGEGRVFLFAPAPGFAWLGRTPETLVQVDSGEIRTEAVAGTRGMGRSFALIHDSDEIQEKETLEHRVVVSHLTRALEGLGLSADVGARSIRNAGSLTHLVTEVRAHAARVDLAALIDALHPTSAMNGAPREGSLNFLRRWEGFDRGWYAGFVGSLGSASADVVVGIRGARIDPWGCTLYAGGGLVHGSIAEDEARETEAKTRAIANGFGWEVP